GEPARITTSIGQAHLANRCVTLALSEAFLLLVAFACVQALVWTLRLQPTRRALAAAPAPTLVTLTNVLRVRGYGGTAALWSFTWPVGANRFRLRDRLDAPATEPLIVDPARGLALALADPAGRAMLVTTGLTNLQVSDTERQAVLDAIAREQAR